MGGVKTRGFPPYVSGEEDADDDDAGMWRSALWAIARAPRARNRKREHARKARAFARARARDNSRLPCLMLVLVLLPLPLPCRRRRRGIDVTPPRRPRRAAAPDADRGGAPLRAAKRRC